jgi:hypothetical protein
MIYSPFDVAATSVDVGIVRVFPFEIKTSVVCKYVLEVMIMGAVVPVGGAIVVKGDPPLAVCTYALGSVARTLVDAAPGATEESLGCTYASGEVVGTISSGDEKVEVELVCT